MAGRLSVAAKNATVSWWTTQITKVSVHTADPGPTGANEASGGGYSRQDPGFGTVALGAVPTGTMNFPLPIGTFTHLGLWAGTTYWGKVDLAAPQVYSVAQTLTITTLTLDENAVASA